MVKIKAFTALNKTVGMQIVGSCCKFDKCKNMAKYNLKNMKRQYCEEHKTDKMVESGKPVCQINECLTIAIYGDEGQKASRCVVHKEKEMVDLFHRTCIFEGCKSRPSYGNGNTVLYCTKHKTDGMVDNLHTII
jgi:hypothetical protein